MNDEGDSSVFLTEPFLESVVISHGVHGVCYFPILQNIESVQDDSVLMTDEGDSSVFLTEPFFGECCNQPRSTWGMLFSYSSDRVIDQSWSPRSLNICAGI